MRVTRTREPARPALRSSPNRSAPATAKQKAVDVGELRIYHLTHIKNLPGILATGSLLADQSESWIERPVVDISRPELREARRTAHASQTEVVADYVPFFVSPHSTLWTAIRGSDLSEPRLAPEARALPANEFIVLVSTVGNAGRDRVVVTNGDATGIVTRFTATPDQAEAQLRRLQGDEQSLAEAELLVHESFPFSSITLIGVANDKIRNEVRDQLAASGHAPKLSIYPPWFQVPAESV
ncbi:MAG: DarT ssDNA thymidine ADP-ribosyltransferase family protein [Microbacteriaceae bacterium]